jgi:hypothetical protein
MDAGAKYAVIQPIIGKDKNTPQILSSKQRLSVNAQLQAGVA